MSVEEKIPCEVKLNAVLSFLNGNEPQSAVARKFGTNRDTLRDWILQYNANGEAGLKQCASIKKWDEAVKISAVKDYLNGEGSLRKICAKYKISSKTILKDWLKMYNGCEFQNNTKNRGRTSVIKSRKTDFDERVEAVQFCVKNNMNYALTIEKYNISYGQIYSWIKKYKEKGIEGLVDNRGKAKPESELTTEDKLKAQNKILEANNKRLEMEIHILKKLTEVERRLH